MKNKLFLVLFIFSTVAQAQVTQRNILSNKYSLQDIQQSLIPYSAYAPYPKTTAAWKAAVPDSILKKLVKEGEAALNFKFESITATVSLNFVRNGNRSEHGSISFSKRQALKRLIIAESIENNNRFTEAILNGVWSICEESFWGVPAHLGSAGLPDVENPLVELFSAETGTLLALADYLVGDKLDKANKQFRNRIYTETNKRLFQPMLTKSDSYGWMSKTKPVNNWNPWIHSNLIMTTLLLEKDPQKRAQYIYNSLKGIDLYMNGLGDEGGCDEGPSYWFAAGASIFDCLEDVQAATNGKVNVYENELIKKMASYIYKTHIGGKYFVNFSDADPKLLPDGLMMYRFGKAINDAYLSDMGQWAYQTFNNLAYANPHSDDDFHRPRYLKNILTVAKLEKDSKPYVPIQDVWINDVQELTARSNNGFYLATHGGHNAESHNHNDVGDFILYANDEPLIIDAGRGNYTAKTFSPQRYELWFTQSQYHNLPIINGFGQLAGRNFAAKNVKNTIDAKQATLTMNLADAYDSAAAIDYWNRTVSLNRVKNCLEINDKYALQKALTSYQQIFMTVCAVDISVAGKIKLTTPKQLSYTIEYDESVWTPTIETPSIEGPEYSNLKTKWDGKSIQRIVLNCKKLQKKGSTNFTVIKN